MNPGRVNDKITTISCLSLLLPCRIQEEAQMAYTQILAGVGY